MPLKVYLLSRSCHDVEQSKATERHVEMKDLNPKDACCLQGISCCKPSEAVRNGSEKCDDRCVEGAEVHLQLLILSFRLHHIVQNHIGEKNT